MARKTIVQRIALEGGKEMEAQLKTLGVVGEKAFAKIQASALKADFARFAGSAKTFGSDLATVARRLVLAFSGIAVAATAAGVGVLKLAKDGAAAADAAGKAAQKSGLQIDAYGRLAFAAEMADVSQETFQVGMNKLNKALGLALGGNKKAIKQFTDLGVSITGANGKLRPVEAIIGDIAEAFKRMPDGVKKSSLALSLFGKGGAQLIPFLNEGRAGLKALGEEAERLGIVFTAEQFALGDELGDSLDRVGVAIKALKAQFGLLFAPLVIQGANKLRDIIVANKDAILAFGRALSGEVIGIVNDLVAALSGKDADVQRPWILVWRDAVVTFGEDVQSVITTAILPAFKLLREGAELTAKAINSIFGTNLSAGELLLGAAILRLLGVFAALRSGVMFVVDAVRLLSGSLFLISRHPVVAALTVLAVAMANFKTSSEIAEAATKAHKTALDDLKAAFIAASDKTDVYAQGALKRLAQKHREAAAAALADAQDQVTAAQQILSIEKERAQAEADVPGGESNPLAQGLLQNELKRIEAREQKLAAANVILERRKRELKEIEDAATGKQTTNIEDLTAATEKAGTVIQQTAEKTGAATDKSIAKVEKLNDAVGKTITVRSGGETRTFDVLDSGAVKAQGSVDALTDSSEEAADAIDDIGASAGKALVNVTRLNIATADELKANTKARTKKDGTIDESVPDLTKIQTQAVEVTRVVDDTVDAAKAKLSELAEIPAPSDALTKGLPEADAALKSTVQNVTAAASGAQAGVDAFGQSLTEAASGAQAGVDALGKSLTSAGTSAQAALVEVPSAAKVAVDGLITELSRVQPVVDAISTSFKNIFGTVQSDEEKEAATAALVAPFALARDQIGAIWAQIKNFAVSGINAVVAEVGRLTSQINQMISSIIAALQRAIAAAARLRAQASARSAAGSERFASGVVRLHGPGTGTSDSIVARLSRGESVITAKATNHWSQLLRAINAGLKPEELPEWLRGLRGFSVGRVVDGIKGGFDGLTMPRLALGTVALAPAAPGVSRTAVHLHLPNGEEIIGLFKPEDVAKKMMQYATQRAIRSTGRKPGWKG